eukprot:1563601-Alexandrium_andersonii.AAC.1
MAKAIFLCLLDQQRKLTRAWGRGHGKEMITVGSTILHQVKGVQEVNAGHNFLKDYAEAWAELASCRRAWGVESGSIDLLKETRTALQAAQLGRAQLPGNLRAVMDVEIDLLQ